MAEADKMLIAVEFDASGAIKDATVLDTKFDKLGNTLRKGEKRAEGAAAAQKKLDKSIQGTTKSTVDANVQSIAKLAALEATTSAINQGISARYKQIDADVASGEISAEEGEQKRKQIKQWEKYTGWMEMVIAAERLRTVGLMFMSAWTAKSTATTELNTAAVARNNAALAMNPYVRFAMIALTVISVLALMELKFDSITKIVKKFKDVIDGLIDSLEYLSDLKDWSPTRQLEEGMDSFGQKVKGKIFGGGRLA